MRIMISILMSIFLLSFSSALFAAIDIYAQSAVLDKQHNIATYTTDVVLTRENARISADTIVVKMLDSEKKHYHAQAEGNAHFSNKSETVNVTGAAKQIIYTNSDEKVELRGDATITQNGNTMHGEHITYFIVQDAIYMDNQGQGKVNIKLEL